MSDNRREGRGPSLEQICGEIMKEANKSELATPAGSDDPVLEALKECEYALGQLLRTGKVGWLQEQAHKTACETLTKRQQNNKEQP